MIIDIHAHVLPKVDDGAKDWDTCLRMLCKSAKAGVQKVIATPHYYPWGTQATAEQTKKLCMEAQEKLYKEHGITMDIYPGHEIYYNVGVMEQIKSGKILTLAESRYALVEFEPETPYSVMCYAVREFVDNRYVPILAHTERYLCLRRGCNAQRLKEMGALFQMNVETLNGGFFSGETRWAKQCLRKGMTDFLASDMHNLKTRIPIAKENLEWVYKTLDSDYQKKILCDNCEKIIANIKQ